MGQADIAYMIKRIYEKYNATQKDKKHEERVYMGEDEFRYNLEEMVKKSPIDDKVLLYKEIYRNISENSLEIDSNGTITISPKLIIEVEKEIKLKQERETEVLNSDGSVVESNNIEIPVTDEDYRALSEKEKNDIFYRSAGWIFGSEEKAAKARETLENIEIDTTVSAEEAREDEHKGKPVAEETYKRVTGDSQYSSNDHFRQARLDLKVIFQKVLEDNRLKLFFIEENGKAKIDMSLLMAVSHMMKEQEIVEFSDIEREIKEYYEARSEKNPNIKMPSKEQLEGLSKIFQDKDKFVGIVSLLQLMGDIDKSGQEISAMENGKLFEELYNKLCSTPEVSIMIKSFAKEYGLDIESYVFSGYEHNQMNDTSIGSDTIPQFGTGVVNTASMVYDNFIRDKQYYLGSKLAEGLKIDKKVVDVVQRGVSTVELEGADKDLLQKYQKSARDVVDNENNPVMVNKDFLNPEGYVKKSGKDTGRKLSDTYVLVDKTYIPKDVKKTSPVIEGDIRRNDSAIEARTGDVDEHVFIDRAHNPYSNEKKITIPSKAPVVDIPTVEPIPESTEIGGDSHVFVDKAINPHDIDTAAPAYDSEASVGEITDFEMDSIGELLEDMAVGDSEPETDFEHEGATDIPIGARTGKSGVVMEDIHVGGTVAELASEPKVNESTVPPVVESHEPIENPGMLSVDTFSNKIKRKLTELGNKVKGIFGKIASAFSGNSDTGNNNGTSGTGGPKQEPKPQKTSQVPGQDFIQHVELDFSKLKSDSGKGDATVEPKGVDDPTQGGFEVDD